MKVGPASAIEDIGRVPAQGMDSALSIRQALTASAWGVLLWFLVAMFVRYAPAGLFDHGAATIALFACAVLIGWPTVVLTRWVIKLRPDQLVIGTAVASGAALLCDGLALTWSPLYSPDGRDLAPAAAWIMWGVGVFVVWAFFLERRRPR